MRREVPLAITFITGFLLIIGFFIPHDPIGGLQSMFLQWYAIIAGFTMVLGLMTLTRIHTRRIVKRTQGFGYSVILIGAMLGTLVVGFYSGIKYKGLFELGTPFMWYYNNILVPLSATMFSLLAFFIASAAYRAFRARTIEATLLLIAGVLVMIGRVPVGNLIWNKLPIIAEWIMNIPQLAAKRGILIGVALGMIATSLRIILGIERTYLK
ncbi:hypothetical protein KAW65_04435 [candidate division WOR-3 bacterium]|nr:hypothetical protein [candidate division WOR-3 bacterium]